MKIFRPELCILFFSFLILSQTSIAGQAEGYTYPAFSGDFPIVNGTGKLSISGPGGFWESYSFDRGDRPYLSAYDGQGYPLADGQYSFDFISYQEEPVAATGGGGGLSLSKNIRIIDVRLTGTFSVAGGVVLFE